MLIISGFVFFMFAMRLYDKRELWRLYICLCFTKSLSHPHSVGNIQLVKCFSLSGIVSVLRVD